MKKWSIQVAHLQQQFFSVQQNNYVLSFFFHSEVMCKIAAHQIAVHSSQRTAGLMHTSAMRLWVAQCGSLPLQEQQARFLLQAVAVYWSVVLLGISELLSTYSPVLRICCHSFYFCKTLLTGTFSHTHLLLWIHSDVVFNEDKQKQDFFLWKWQDTLFCLDCLLIAATAWQAFSFLCILKNNYC